MAVIIALIFLILIVYWIGTECGESAGVIALAVLLAGLAIAICGAGKKCDKAFNNVVNYWSGRRP